MKSLLFIFLFISFSFSLFAQDENDKILETARKNIEQHRKTDFSIQLSGDNISPEVMITPGVSEHMSSVRYS